MSNISHSLTSKDDNSIRTDKEASIDSNTRKIWIHETTTHVCRNIDNVEEQLISENSNILLE